MALQVKHPIQTCLTEWRSQSARDSYRMAETYKGSVNAARCVSMAQSGDAGCA